MSQLLESGIKRFSGGGRNIVSLMQTSRIMSFQQWGILTSVDSDDPVKPAFSLETPK